MNFLADSARTSLELPYTTLAQRRLAEQIVADDQTLQCERCDFGQERWLHIFKQSDRGRWYGSRPPGMPPMISAILPTPNWKKTYSANRSAEKESEADVGHGAEMQSGGSSSTAGIPEAATEHTGVPIVTDLQFWKNDRSWAGNCRFLTQHRALLIEGVDAYDVAGTLGSRPDFKLNLSDIGLIVIGGFHPHYLMSACVQTICQQLPFAEIMMLYASRDTPPDFQDKHLFHMQAWTADADHGYVVRAGRQGIGGPSRCHSSESKKRKVVSDPGLVKVSVFTRSPANVRMMGTQISPSGTVQLHLNAGRHVLFCGEGNASLACSCLRTPPSAAVQLFPTPNRFLEDSTIETYATLLQRSDAEGTSREDAAYQWMKAWPTTMPLQDTHRLCGCLMSDTHI